MTNIFQALNSFPNDSGPVRRRHEASARKLLISTSFGCLVSLLGAISILVVIACHSLWLQVALGVFLPLVGATLMLGGLVFFLNVVCDVGTTFHVTEQGLSRERFGRSTFFRWDQVKEIYKKSGYFRQPGAIGDLLFVGYGLTLDDGTRLLIRPNIEDIRQLGEVIEERTAPFLERRALQCYRDGEPIDFGAIKVGDNGVCSGTVLVPWEDVKTIYIDYDGWLVIERKGKSTRESICVSLGKVKNPHVLFKVLRTLKKIS